jgi:hypothetical protein
MKVHPSQKASAPYLQNNLESTIKVRTFINVTMYSQYNNLKKKNSFNYVHVSLLSLLNPGVTWKKHFLT